MKKYTLAEVFTVNEAAQRYNISKYTIQNKLKPSTAASITALNAMEELGIIRRSCNTWLITHDFMKLHFDSII